MLNFDKNKFDFNQVLEAKQTPVYKLSLDDFEDEFNSIEEEPESKKRNVNDLIDTDIDFRLFLKANIFKYIEVDVDPTTGNSLSGNNRCAWKSYIENGEKHYLAYINIIQSGNKKNYEHDIYVDLNVTTNELHIGNCTTFKTTKFLNVSYPLIKICEHYKDGPVYIGCIYMQKPWAIKNTANDVLNSIECPLDYLNVTNDVSFWRTVWNGKGYYLPDVRPGMKLTNIDNNLKLTSDFVNHFAGFDSTLRGVKSALFYNMFNSFEDFHKISKCLCDQGAMVFTEFGIELTKTNYDETLQAFANKLGERLDFESERQQKLIDDEEKAKNYLLEILPQNVIDHFESINSKFPNLLSTRTMFKERKSKDPYRKFDLPVIKLILKDNGIDVDKIVNDYEQQWLSTFYNFTNTFYKHCKELDINCESNSYGVYTEYDYIVHNLFVCNRQNIMYTNNSGNKCDFDGLTEKEAQMIKDMAFGLIPTLEWEDRKIAIDTQRLDNPNDEVSVELCRKLLMTLGQYPESVINDNIDNHTYNVFLIIQRFVYLLYKLYSEDFNKNRDVNDDELPEPDRTALFNMKYSYVSFGYYGDYYPFNLGDINMKLNTYNQLYKFITYIAYIIENGYDIHCPNIGGVNCSNEKLLIMYNLRENLNDLVDKEFSLNNTPNIKLLNMDSIIKMLSTIFTNIDKKI